ncbi:MAG: alanine racemase [Kiritimatiellaeota bacterium]|nr:alanine racemase [Kiritimatiellota bacterium]
MLCPRENPDAVHPVMPRAWVEIDVRAWEENFRAVAGAVSPATVLAVVKANAYGLGAPEAARAFRRAGCRHLAVASIEEGRELLDLGMQVLLLGAVLPAEVPAVVETGIVASIPDYATALRISDAAQAVGRRVSVHIQVDSGMGRLGIVLSSALDEILRISRLPGILTEGIYTHFPTAGRRDAPTYRQIAEFASLVRELESAGCGFKWRHMANSAAVAGLPEAYRAPFNMVRPGLDLHGAHLSITPRPYRARPVFSLKSRLVGIRTLPQGATVGYGRTYAVTRPGGERIGTVAIGYADGYPRSLSNTGSALVRERTCPVVGMVCMDYTMISLENVPDAEIGDEVVLVGNTGPVAVSIAAVARKAGTIPYELMCQIGRRVHRRYVGRDGENSRVEVPESLK